MTVWCGSVLTVDDMFSCIGSHSYGLRLARGFRTLRFVEIDEWRRRVLAAHFPRVPIVPDIHDARGIRADLLIGGPPCQRTAALAAVHGYRSGESLWPEMRRIAAEGNYRWIVVEQPSSAGRVWFAALATDLATDGWHVEQPRLTACGLGAPHIRPRVFTIAHRNVSRLAIARQALARAADRIARGTSTGNPWLSGPPGDLRVADGPTGGLDGYTVNRRRRIEAIGDSNPPAMALALGRAILAAERARTRPDGA